MAVTETRTLPPKYVEDLGKDYSTQLTGLTSQKMDTTKFQPMVAGQDQAQKDAYSMATTQGQGIGSYAPYLQQAGAFQQGTGTFAGQPANMMGSQDYLQAAQQQSGLAGLQSQAAQAQSTAQGALSGPNAYKQFMSPYQQDVINATMTDYDKQAAKGMTSIGQNAAMSGNLGGGREGVMRAEYKNQSDMNRALLQGKMLQQGFGQAQTQANTAFGQQGQLFGNQQNLFNNQQSLFGNQQNLMQGANTLGADQQRMAQLVPGLYGSDVQALQQAGSGQQLQAQNVLDQQREANRMAAYEPYERLNYMGAGMGNVMGAGMGQYTSKVTPNQSPLQQAMGIASLGLGAYKGYKNNT
jgi:hypothetical protein